MMWIWIQIARTAAGFTGADLENLMNRSAIAAAKEGHVILNVQNIFADPLSAWALVKKEKPGYFG